MDIKVLAAVPCYHAMEPEPLMSFLIASQETGRAEARGEYAVRWLVGGPKVNAEVARNSAVMASSALGATHLFLVDDDMIYPADIIGRLLKHDKDIVAPLFFRSAGNFDPLVFMSGSGGEMIPYYDYPKNELFRVTGGVGTGCMLIKTDVLRAMHSPWFCFPEDLSRASDLNFCYKAAGIGFEIWCDSSIILNQMGLPYQTGLRDFEAHRKNLTMN